MAISYILYELFLSYVVGVGVSLLLYGGIDYLRDSLWPNSSIELLAGATILIYLLIFYSVELTRTIPRELAHGSLASKSYIVLPLVVGFISTDYLLRRIVPLLHGVVQDRTAQHRNTKTTIRSKIGSRRAVLAGVVGIVTPSLLGGLTIIQDILRSPTPDASEISAFQLQASFEAPYFPTALDFSERGYGFVTNMEGKIFRFEQPSPDQDSLEFTQVASGLEYPHGVEVVGETVYTVDNGNAAGGKYGEEEGYEVLHNSNGTVVAFDIEPDGSLSNKRTIVSNLPVVNHDHALQQIVTGPDERLYLSIGHLGGQKYPELFENGNYEPSEEDHPGIEYLGTVISFEPDGSDLEIMARGLRNVYDLAFDQHGNLFGANNDGMSIRSKVRESLCHITEGANFGYPEYGTFAASPGDGEIADPLWTLDGVSSTGIETTDKIGSRDGVVVGLAGKVVFVPIETRDDAVFVPEFSRAESTIMELNSRPIIVEAGPDGFLWVGSTGSDDTFSLYTTGS